MKTRIEVISNEWAGTLRDGWRPAVDGTLNNTSMSAEDASVFDSPKDALDFVRRYVLDQNPDAYRLVDADTGAVLSQECRP